MTKLQRVTKAQVLSTMKYHVKAFADSMQKQYREGFFSVYKLAQHKEYTKGSIENFMFKLIISVGQLWRQTICDGQDARHWC